MKKMCIYILYHSFPRKCMGGYDYSSWRLKPGMGVTKPSSSIPFPFPYFSWMWKYTLAIEYHINIWQVAPQLSCGDTCQMWMCFKKSYRYFCKIKIFFLRRNWHPELQYPHHWLPHTAITADDLVLPGHQQPWYWHPVLPLYSNLSTRSVNSTRLEQTWPFRLKYIYRKCSSLKFIPTASIGCVSLAVITGTIILVPFLKVNSLQHIKDEAPIMPNLQMSYRGPWTYFASLKKQQSIKSMINLFIM